MAYTTQISECFDLQIYKCCLPLTSYEDHLTSQTLYLLSSIIRDNHVGLPHNYVRTLLNGNELFSELNFLNYK